MMNIVLAGVMLLAFALDQTGSSTNAMIRGTVTSDNHALAGANVMAYSDVGVEQTKTDKNGNYVFLKLNPGVYKVYAYTSPTRFLSVSDLRVAAGMEYLANFDL